MWGSFLGALAIIMLWVSSDLDIGSWWRDLWISLGVALAAYAVFTLLLHGLGDARGGWLAVFGLVGAGVIVLLVSRHLTRGWWEDVSLEMGVALVFLALIESVVGAIIRQEPRRGDEPGSAQKSGFLGSIVAKRAGTGGLRPPS